MFWFLPMMVMVLLSIPVAFSLGLAGFFGIVFSLNWMAGCSFVKTILYGAMESYALSCVPMFILMGELAFQAGISGDLFDAASKWLGRTRGGMLLATNYGCALVWGLLGVNDRQRFHLHQDRAAENAGKRLQQASGHRCHRGGRGPGVHDSRPAF